MKIVPHREEGLNDRLHVELVRSLFSTVAPSIVMSLGFAGSVAMMWSAGGSPILAGLGLTGLVASVVRVGIAIRSGKEARATNLTAARARTLERRFAISYLAFALILGTFGVVTLSHGPSDSHMLMVVLLVGYAAGVATGVGLRPWIAIPAMVFAIVPAVAAAALHSKPFYLATSAMMVALLAGAIQSMLKRYRTQVRDTRQRLTFATLARSDDLTALPNRLALREWFEDKMALRESSSIVAVHYLDLNGFKPVNDRYGHPVVDELLRAVASRLARLLRKGDIAARLGGDEFAVVQFGLRRSDEAEWLAQRLCRAMKDPFSIGTHRIGISGCVGYVTSDQPDDELDHLLSLADECLYAAKRGSRHVVGSDISAMRRSKAA
jgi:diguanylate cyclase (GGDEF)-like protein